MIVAVLFLKIRDIVLATFLIVFPAGTFEMRIYADAEYASDVVVMVSRVCHGSPRLRLEGQAPSPAITTATTDRLLLRVHDQCATSEVFGSLKCDCRQQLDASLEAMRAAAVSAFDAAPSGSANSGIIGVLVYLPQEGRGIGLASKVAAYALQQSGADGPPGSACCDKPVASGQARGLDTVDANRALGLPDDSRHYGAVPRVLADLGIIVERAQDASAATLASDGALDLPRAAAGLGREWALAPDVRPLALLTNSPRKAELLAALGVPVAARLPCLVPAASAFAREYLRAKAQRMGHDIPERFFALPTLPQAIDIATGEPSIGNAATAAAAQAAAPAAFAEDRIACLTAASASVES